MSDEPGPEGTAPCPRCGYPVAAKGFEIIDAGFPGDLDDIERVVTAATRFSFCPQCLAPNEGLERVYSVAFRPSSVFYLRVPSDAGDDDVEALSALPDGWSAQPYRDVDEFRQAVGKAVLGLVRFVIPGEFSRVPAEETPPMLAPAGERDRDYHAALALIGRPGFLVFDFLPEGVTETEARAELEEARKFQLAISLFKAFARMPLAGFDPVAEIAERFVPECFQDDETLETIATLIDGGTGEGDVAVLYAALSAAAATAGRTSPRRRELAEELVKRLIAGEAVHDNPGMWRDFVDAADVLRALMAGRSRLEDEEDVNQIKTVAAALGHGEDVLRRLQARHRFEEPVDPARLVDGAFEVVAERQAGDEVLADLLSMLARTTPLGDARSVVRLSLGRLDPERKAVAVLATCTLAKRLTNEGEARSALELLNEVEDAIDWDRVPPEAAATGRAALLIERGNARRALLDAEGALIDYQSALRESDGHVHDQNLRIIRLNQARALRDAGQLPRAIAAFKDLLGPLEGRERFDCLFGLALALQRNGQWAVAQPVLDEALELVQSEPIDDQLARFVLARLANARALGTREQTPLIEAVQTSPLVSARQKLLTIGAASVTALRIADPDTELATTALELVRGLGDLPDLARRDPQLALMWADTARLAGDMQLARDTVETALEELHEPVLGMHAASVAARIAVDEGRWPDVIRRVDQAIRYMTSLVVAASADSDTVTLADALTDVRELGAELVSAPPGTAHDRLLSRVADLGSSLQMSVQIASEHIPVSHELRAPPGTRLQVLQWLDAGDVQLPLLAEIDEREARLHRGAPLPTRLVAGLGTRIAGRVSRSPALAAGDLLEGVEQYRELRRRLDAAIRGLPIDTARPLTVAPSAPMIGVPLHHALAGFDIAFTPSLAVALALAHRVADADPELPTVGEIRCWCHGDSERLTAALIAGGDRLRGICRARGVTYEDVAGLDASRAGVSSLLDRVTWLKLSCHGVTEPTRARFALVLSDGRQAPPALSEVLERPAFAGRYLFDWSEVSRTRSRCRAVVSSACTSGSAGATAGGEQIGLARAYLSRALSRSSLRCGRWRRARVRTWSTSSSTSAWPTPIYRSPRSSRGRERRSRTQCRGGFATPSCSTVTLDPSTPRLEATDDRRRHRACAGSTRAPGRQGPRRGGPDISPRDARLGPSV